MREICSLIPEQKLKFFYTRNQSYAMPGNSNDLHNMVIEAAPLPLELLIPDSKTPIFKELSLKKKRNQYWVELENLKQKIVAYAKSNDCTAMLVVLASPSLILIAEDIARTLKVDLTCLVWDPPESTMNYLHFEKPLRNLVLKRFEHLLKFAKKVSVASEGMRVEYKMRYGIDGIPLIRPVRDDRIQNSFQLTRNSSETEITIGFSGSLYAMDEFLSLLEALSTVDFVITGKAVTVKVYGNYLFFNKNFLQKNVSLQLYGYRDQIQTVEELSKCDLVYLPYWFDKKYSLSVRTCFPDKMSTYLSSGAPIFYHGPEDSTPAEFIRSYPVGKSCHTTSAEDIIEKITTLATNMEFRENASKARSLALAQEYSLDGFRDKVSALLQVTKEDLSAPNEIVETTS